jgi:hydrophobe/amphiphile efflux-1 (HAE1) family protein
VNISGPFLRRPIATSLLAVALILAGLTAYFNLAVAPLPRVDFPTINVQAALPGASPETMASSVATPLERRFGRISGLTEMTSASSLGSTSITMQFDLNRDITGAARDVQAAMNAAGGELPPNLPSRPTYRKVNPADAPVLIVGLYSDTLPLAQVYDTANTILAQKVSQVQGVGQVFVGGGQQPAVRVQVDLDALAGLGLGMVDVRTALAQATVNSPEGALANDQRTLVLSSNDQLFGAEAFRNLIVTYRKGAPVRLRDVAKVFDDVENNRVAGWVDGKRAVVLIVRREPGANILETIDRVKALLPSLATSISPAIKMQIALDRAGTIRASVRDVEMTLLISIGLVVLVVLLFLRRLRATMIPAVAIPLSLTGTFAVMYLLNYSIDNLSLMALTIATGFVVDDAIVVVENIMRHVEQGMSPSEAAYLGAKEIGFTIVSITVSLLAVFIPLLLMGGIVGRLFREFSVTLSIAIVVSAVVSLTLTPTMSSRLLRQSTHEEPTRFARVSERGFTGLQGLYARCLDWILRHQVAALALTVGTVAFTVFLYVVVPKGLFPQQDTGMLTGSTEASQDVSFPAMKAYQEQVNAIVSADPDVQHVVSFIGSSNASTGNAGNLFIALKDKPARKSTADEVIARLRPKVGHLPGMRLFLQSVQDLRLGGRSARTQYQYTLQDATLDELNQWAPRVLEKLRSLSALKDVNTDQQTAGLQLGVTLDRERAARFGILPQAVDEALYDAFGQRQVAVSYTQLNYYRVVLEAAPMQQSGPEALRRIYVSTPTGGQVPLSEIATFGPGNASLAINHQGQFPATTISFNLAPGIALGDAVELIHKAEEQLHFPDSLRGSFQGTAQAFKSSTSSQPWLILAALVTVYLVLGMLYESLIHPITILSTLPSAGVGALLALSAFKTEFSIIALIGIVLLIGIVKKNAIILVDFAIESRRSRGTTAAVAIREASLLRFRPILMTTMAALLGALPLAIGGGTGSELRRPLGIAMVGGLFLSQVVTLFTTPVIYLWLDRIQARRKAPLAATLEAKTVTSEVS